MIRPGSRLKPPWTQYKSVDKATKDKRKAWVSYRKSGLEADRLLFEAEIQKKDQTLLEAKAHYEDKLVKDINSNPKRFWNYSKHFTKSLSTINVLVDECGSKIHDDSEKADLLNRFFASTFTDEPDIVTSLPLPETQTLTYYSTLIYHLSRFLKKWLNSKLTKLVVLTKLVKMF